MHITLHAKERLDQRFDIRSESEILKVQRKLERDFIREETDENGNTVRTVIWKNKYMKGVISKDNVLVTIIDNGLTPMHFISRSNPAMKQGKNRYRNRRRRKHDKAFNRRDSRTCW